MIDLKELEALSNYGPYAGYQIKVETFDFSSCYSIKMFKEANKMTYCRLEYIDKNKAAEMTASEVMKAVNAMKLQLDADISKAAEGKQVEQPIYHVWENITLDNVSPNWDLKTGDLENMKASMKAEYKEELAQYKSMSGSIAMAAPKETLDAVLAKYYGSPQDMPKKLSQPQEKACTAKGLDELYEGANWDYLEKHDHKNSGKWKNPSAGLTATQLTEKKLQATQPAEGLVNKVIAKQGDGFSWGGSTYPMLKFDETSPFYKELVKWNTEVEEKPKVEPKEETVGNKLAKVGAKAKKKSTEELIAEMNEITLKDLKELGEK